MTRASREDTLWDVVRAYEARSTCSRAHVSAIIVRDARIISTGYNGAPPGMPHCKHDEVVKQEGGCQVAIHAEANAIAWAARHGVPTEDASMYCTYSPCLDCAKLILSAGIAGVHYFKEYRITAGINLLSDAGVELHHANSR